MPIAYIASASTDGSAELARSMGAVVAALDLALPFTAARARTAGLQAILGGWPRRAYDQFVADDCELELAWLAAPDAFLCTLQGVCARFSRPPASYTHPQPPTP